MAEKEIFEYTYSAPRQSEILQIREKYLPREVTKLDQLRALDESVTKRGIFVSLLHGVLYSLLLGIGMSCCMVWSGKLFVPGIIIGSIGLAGVAMTYPVYNCIVKQDRKKITPEILRLTEDIAFGK